MNRIELVAKHFKLVYYPLPHRNSIYKHKILVKYKSVERSSSPTGSEWNLAKSIAILTGLFNYCLIIIFIDA